MFGLFMGSIGAALLGLESLGVQDLLANMNAGEQFITRLTRIGFTAYLNNVVLFFVISAVGAIGIYVITNSVVDALLFGPLTYFLWRLSTWFNDYTMIWATAGYKFIGNATKALPFFPWGLLGYILIMAPATIILVAVFLFRVSARFATVIPVFFVNERLIMPWLEKCLQATAEWLETQQRWHLKRFAFTGMLLLVCGFMYQLFGTIILTIASTSQPQVPK